MIVHSSTGDLTIPQEHCTYINRFTLPKLPNRCSGHEVTIQSKLARNLLLQVGGDGIIGRRVSISSLEFPSSCIVEGIVGFNTGASLPSLATV